MRKQEAKDDLPTAIRQVLTASRYVSRSKCGQEVFQRRLTAATDAQLKTYAQDIFDAAVCTGVPELMHCFLARVSKITLDIRPYKLRDVYLRELINGYPVIVNLLDASSRYPECLRRPSTYDAVVQAVTVSPELLLQALKLARESSTLYKLLEGFYSSRLCSRKIYQEPLQALYAFSRQSSTKFAEILEEFSALQLRFPSSLTVYEALIRFLAKHPSSLTILLREGVVFDGIDELQQRPGTQLHPSELQLLEHLKVVERVRQTQNRVLAQLAENSALSAIVDVCGDDISAMQKLSAAKSASSGKQLV